MRSRDSISFQDRFRSRNRLFPLLLVLYLLGISGRSTAATITLTSGTSSANNQTYSSTTADESPVLVTSGASLTLTNPTITKSGDSSSNDTSSQYGQNAGVLIKSAGSVTISGGSVTTSAGGANGLFATGTNSSVSMSNGTISTTGEASHGVDATYGGIVTLNNVNVSTTGNGASAAISTDFGGGTVTVTGGVITTTGTKSPAIYSTGTITINSATMTASGGAGAVIDGGNSIILNSTNLTGTTSGIKLHNTTSSTSSATVTITGGKLIANAGEAFLLVAESGAIKATLTVKGGASISSSTGVLVNATSNTTATFIADGVTLSGNLTTDSTSAITAKLQNSATVTGSASSAAMTIDSSSTWVASGASTLTSLSNSGTVSLNTISSKVTVTGAATLGGKLYVNLGSTLPSAGSYTVLTAGSISGSFSSLELSSSAMTGSLAYTSTGVTLTLAASSTVTAPSITTQPSGSSATAGSSVTLSVVASGSSLSYQWYKDGSAISGATSSSYTISSLSSTTAGSYVVTVTNLGGSVTSNAVTVSIKASTSAQLTALSVRAAIGSDSNTLIAGIVLSGSSSKTLLLRGVGPALVAQGVSSASADTNITIFNASGSTLGSNNDWGSSSAMSTLFASVGASAFASSSKDAALSLSLSPGNYTAHVSGSSGVALAEAYDCASSDSGSKLLAVSGRSFVGTGDNVMIAGFVIANGDSLKVLVRGLGPALSSLGVSGSMANPILKIYNSSGTLLASNDDWSGSSELTSAMTKLCGSAPSSSSKDSALLISLPAGAYTAIVSGVDNSTGVALVDVYDASSL